MRTNSKVQSLKAKVHKPEAEARRPRAEVRNPKPETRRQISEDGRQKTEDRGAAAVGYLSGFLCVGFALALLVTGCVGHRELLAALERQATRINAVESGLARVDERRGCNHAAYLQNAGVWTSSAVLTGRGQPGGLEDLGVLARDATTPARHFDATYQVDQGGYPPACSWACKRRSGGIRLAKGVTNPSCAELRRAQAVEIFLKVGVAVHVPDAVAIGGIIWI